MLAHCREVIDFGLSLAPVMLFFSIGGDAQKPNMSDMRVSSQARGSSRRTPEDGLIPEAPQLVLTDQPGLMGDLLRGT